MGLHQNILKAIQNLDLSLRVTRAQIGLIYTACQIQGGSTGVAFSFPRTGCGLMSSANAIPLVGRPARELVSRLGDPNLTASSLGLAAINALISNNVPSIKYQEGDVLEWIHIQHGDRVCMVGSFAPVIERLKRLHVDLAVIEKEREPRSREEEVSFALLQRSQVAIITATSIINGTIDGLLTAASGCREVAILGPSTPMIPEAFSGTPVTWLSGIRVEQPGDVLRVIAEAGGFRTFKRYITKLNLRLRN